MDIVLQWVNPTLVSIIVGIGVSVALALILLNTYKMLFQEMKRALGWLRKSLFTWRFFFWVVNIICMVFSAQNAGYFFGLYEPIGIALAFVLDLMIITFTQAMLSARAQGDEKRARQVLSFIFLCAFLSTIGNLVHNLQTQDTITLQVNHVWFQPFLPYISSCVPLFLVLLALVADLVTKANLDNIDVSVYEEQEKKRSELLEKRNQYRERQNQAESQFLALLVAQRDQKSFYKGALPKSFRWPWETRVDMEALINGVGGKLATIYDAKKEALSADLLKKQQETEKHFTDLLAGLQQQLLQQNNDVQQALAARYDQEISRLSATLQSRIEGAIVPLEARVIGEVDHRLQGQNDAVFAALSANNPPTHAGQKEQNTAPIPASNEEGNEESKRELSEAEKATLINYPIVASWLTTGLRSVSIEQIIADTGHTPQLIRRREKEGVFKRTRREGHYRVDSVITWLVTAPLPGNNDRNKLRKSSEKVEDNQPITEPISTPIPASESVSNQQRSSDGNGSHNGHLQGHKREEIPLNFPELDVSSIT